MELYTLMIVNTAIIILGFCFVFYQMIKYFKHQDILRKSETVEDYTQRELAINNSIINEPIGESKEEVVLKDITETSAEEAFKLR
jgi:hypothetical protein